VFPPRSRTKHPISPEQSRTVPIVDGITPDYLYNMSLANQYREVTSRLVSRLAYSPLRSHAGATSSVPATSVSEFLTTSIPPYRLQSLRTTKSCTKKLEVVLSRNVEGLGTAGEVKLVSSGYARNYLLPNRLGTVHIPPIAAGDRSGRLSSKHRRRGLPLAAAMHSELAGSSSAASVDGIGDVDREGSGAGSLATSRDINESISRQKRESKKILSIVRKLTENAVVFKGVKSANGVLESPIGPSEIRVATAKQLGIEIVDDLIDMEGDVLDRTGDFLIPLKLVHQDNSRAKLNVRIHGES
jgi:large subunit ribosomal protein L9